MALLLSAIDPSNPDYSWVEEGTVALEVTEGSHAGKLFLVTQTQKQNDGGAVDRTFIKTFVQMVTHEGEPVLVGSTPIHAHMPVATIYHGAIANGDIDPQAEIARYIQDAVERCINLQTTVGAFAFLPQSS